MGVATFIVALVLHAQAQRAHQLALRTVWPAQGMITSPFGRDGYRWHPGIDIGVLRSLSIRAAQTGVVERVGYPAGFNGYGEIVEIRHARYDELYAHLSAYRVRVGQRVWAGQRIGTAGCTGYCTGTHLHFEVRLRGKPVSPLTTVLRPIVKAQPSLKIVAYRQPMLNRLISRLS